MSPLEDVIKWNHYSENWLIIRRYQAKEKVFWFFSTTVSQVEPDSRWGEVSLYQNIPANKWRRKTRGHYHFTTSNETRHLGEGNLWSLTSQKQRQADVTRPRWKHTTPARKYHCTKPSNLNLVMFLVPTTNLQAVQGAEEHVAKPQKGNQKKIQTVGNNRTNDP